MTVSSRIRHALRLLEAQLHRYRAPITNFWAPGLPPEDCRARVIAQTGLPLPVEAQVWFAWHNGIRDREELRSSTDEMFIPGYRLLSLDECLNEYRMRRHLAREMEDEVPEETIWHRGWLPIATDVGSVALAIDCTVEPNAAAPLHRVAPHESPTHPSVASSLADAVEYWVDLFAAGKWYYDPTSGWEKTFGRLDPGIRTGLV